jgi:hypothetical protein
VSSYGESIGMRNKRVRSFKISIALFLLSTTYVSAQMVRVGVIGGLPLTNVFDAKTDLNRPIFRQGASEYSSAIQRTVPYVIGPTVEFRLTSQFRIEFDALYSRGVYHYSEIYQRSPSSGSVLRDAKHGVHLLEFPTFMKYSLRERHSFRPFVGGGVSVEYANDHELEGLSGTVGPFGPPSYSLIENLPTQDGTSVGAVVVGGLVLSLRGLSMSPQIRYTRWFVESVEGRGVLPAKVLRSKQNEVQLLVGINF